MQRTPWTERKLNFDLPLGMLPYYLERAEGTTDRLKEKVKNIPDEILSNKFDGKWSVKQNIGHLGEVDEINLARINEILNGDAVMSSAVFETKQDFNAQPVNTVIDYFRQNRMNVINRLKNLSDEELRKSALHPRLKVLMTPVDLTWFQCEHDDHHMVRMNEIIVALSM